MENPIELESPVEKFVSRIGLREAMKSRRHLSDYLFKISLCVIMLIIVSPFFLVLIQVAGVGFWQVFGTGPGQGLEFFTTFPGAGLEGGIRNAFVGTVELITLASAVGIPLSVLGAVQQGLGILFFAINFNQQSILSNFISLRDIKMHHLNQFAPDICKRITSL